MSDVEELNYYLHNCCTINLNPPFYEKDGFLKALNIYKELKIKEIYTTNIYPRRIKICNQNYLLWDNNLWDLYARFLIGTNKYLKQESNHIITEYFVGLFLLFLSYRFDSIPSLSYLFADYGINTNVIIPCNSINCNSFINNLCDYENTYLVGKWFVFEHEVMHYKYSENKKIFNEHSDLIKTACRYICESLRYNNSLKNDKEKNRYIYFYNIICNNLKYMEELCCDVFAIFNIVPIYAKLYNLPQNEAYGECFRLTRYIIHFQNILNQIEDYWKNSYSYIRKTYLQPEQEYFKQPSEDILNSKRKKQNEQYDLRLFFSQIIAPIIYQILGINITNTMTETIGFFDSDIYKYYFVPMIDNTIINYNFANKIYRMLIDIYNNFSFSKFRKMRNKLIGWE